MATFIQKIKEILILSVFNVLLPSADVYTIVTFINQEGSTWAIYTIPIWYGGARMVTGGTTKSHMPALRHVESIWT